MVEALGHDEQSGGHQAIGEPESDEQDANDHVHRGARPCEEEAQEASQELS